MGGSNEEWGSAPTDTHADLWDRLPELPQAGEDKLFDAFLESKALSREDLIRIGTRWTSRDGHAHLVWLMPDGFKYRRLHDGRRASEEGVEWRHFKRVKSPYNATEAVIAEGETDGATLARLLPKLDVLILPNGAKNVTDEMVALATKYDKVYIGTDNDEAGNEGADKFLRRVPHSVRILPPEGKDWCEAAAVGAVGENLDLSGVSVKRIPRVFSFKELVEADLGDKKDNHWFDKAILPRRGQLIVHAQKKSLKSVLLLELVRSLTTGTPFAGYIPYIADRPAKVLMVQMEIPPYDFRNRILAFARTLNSEQVEDFLANGMSLHMADNQFPRLRVSQKGFSAEVLAVAAEAEADVVVFDPLQRMLGSANANQAHEIDALLSTFEDLQHHGYTVASAHHNNKSERDAKGGHAMTGSQRFSGDPDAICSLWFDKNNMIDDDNPQQIKQRNFSWELRSGTAPGRSVTVRPSEANSELMIAKFDDPIVALFNPDDDVPDI